MDEQTKETENQKTENQKTENEKSEIVLTRVQQKTTEKLTEERVLSIPGVMEQKHEKEVTRKQREPKEYKYQEKEHKKEKNRSNREKRKLSPRMLEEEELHVGLTKSEKIRGEERVAENDSFSRVGSFSTSLVQSVSPNISITKYKPQKSVESELDHNRSPLIRSTSLLNSIPSMLQSSFLIESSNNVPPSSSQNNVPSQEQTGNLSAKVEKVEILSPVSLVASTSQKFSAAASEDKLKSIFSFLDVQDGVNAFERRTDKFVMEKKAPKTVESEPVLASNSASTISKTAYDFGKGLSQLKTQLKESNNQVEILQNQIEKLKESHAKEMKALLKDERVKGEVQMQQNLEIIEKLVKEKEELLKKCESFADEFKSMEDKAAAKLKHFTEQKSRELKVILFKSSCNKTERKRRVGSI